MKNALALLLALAVVVLCAYLPDIVSWRQDEKYLEQVEFASVADGQLEFTNADRTLKETIAILGENMEAVDIPEELASMKKDTVLRIAAATIEKYQAAGLADPEGQYMLEDASPVLVYGDNRRRNSVFWYISYFDYIHNQYAIFNIDDRTGNVVRVEFSWNYEQTKTREDMEFILGNFCQLYLNGLGEEFREYDAQELLDKAKYPNDGSYLANSIYYFVEDYRQNSITFFVNQNGFYTYIS